MLKIIKGNLLTGNYQYIAHQTNCTPGLMGGLAGHVVGLYPNANTKYGICKPGKIDVVRPVINMYSQYRPGHHYGYETETIRQKWFKSCLYHISKIQDLRQIAFPYMIGCGLAGGNWVDYEDILLRFADYMNNVEVLVVKL